MNFNTTLFCVTGYHVYMACVILLYIGIFILFAKYGHKMAGLKPAIRTVKKVWDCHDFNPGPYGSQTMDWSSGALLCRRCHTTGWSACVTYESEK